MMMSDIELKNIDANGDPFIQQHSPPSSSSSNMTINNCNNNNNQESIYVETDYGPINVVRIGAREHSGKPYIITYHDIGLNFHSNFQAFFNYSDMKLLLESFCVINVNAPGQEENATILSSDFIFPTMDQLAEQVDSVCKYFGIANFIGLGVGAGANILARYALKYPELVDGLFLIHPTSTQSSWTEWLYQKMNIYYLSSTVQSFSQSMQDYLLWHHFGIINEDRNRDLIQVYKNYFSGKNHIPRNLALFLDTFIRRTDLNIERGNREQNFKCSILILCGSQSPHVDDTVNMNGRLNPENSTWMKLSGCGMVLDEQPHKVAQAFRLFIQGIGYALTSFERRRSSRQQNGGDDDDEYDTSIRMHIVENPIQN
ncbi:protein NDRG3-like [Dermatophagoides pteronyssinus]|uniref:protein NDRG3-like n=1 Tax=Dermatophagoides pteronyssinus TaxID=6956 RepID=UPI003F6642BC